MSLPQAPLLVELFVEELPPKALNTLGEAFAGTLLDQLRAHGLTTPDAAATPFASPPEDNGSIPLAGDAALVAGAATRTTGTIGDGPHGSAGSGSGDSDFYAVHAAAGQRLIVDAAADGSRLDTVVVLWNSAGDIVAVATWWARTWCTDHPAHSVGLAHCSSVRSVRSFASAPRSSWIVGHGLCAMSLLGPPDSHSGGRRPQEAQLEWPSGHGPSPATQW